MEKGVPPEEIKFIHNANTEQQKAELFVKVRSGDVRVLIGSTGKIRAGTNVQRKLVALHHIELADLPFGKKTSFSLPKRKALPKKLQRNCSPQVKPSSQAATQKKQARPMMSLSNLTDKEGNIMLEKILSEEQEKAFIDSEINQS